MLHDQRAEQSTQQEHSDEIEFRDIHPLTPPPLSSSSVRNRRREVQQPWENTSHRSSSLSVVSTDTLGENFTTMSREFNAMVVAGSNTHNNNNNNGISVNDDQLNLDRIGEEEFEETNPLAIVPDHNPIPSPRRTPISEPVLNGVDDVPVHVVKKEEVETKVCAWQTAEIAKLNNRFKREEVMINGWESEQVEKATAWLKKIERKLDEQRAKAMEKMQNDVAKAHRKAEDKRASAEAKRGVKVAKVLELSNLMRAVGRAPSKRSFF